MRILLTGAGGFIGSFLCRDLLRGGHTIAVLSRSSDPWRLRSVLNQLTCLRGSLADLASVASEIKDFAPDAVAHLAWQGVANHRRNDSGQVANVGWTADMVELSHAAGARTFLGLGSQAEYGPKSVVIGPEEDAAPTTLYGEAKLAAGRIGARLAANAEMRFLWVRVLSTFGPTDHVYWLIPDLIGALLAGKRPALTMGGQLWDFLFVEDAARAIRLALESTSGAGTYVLGSGHARSLRSTIETIRDEIDPGLPLGFGEIPYRADQVMRLEADISALKRDFGWEPAVGFEAAIRTTVQWYRSNRWIYDADRESA